MIKVTANNKTVSIYVAKEDSTIKGKFNGIVENNFKYDLESVVAQTGWNDTLKISVTPNKIYFLTISEVYNGGLLRTDFSCPVK